MHEVKLDDESVLLSASSPAHRVGPGGPVASAAQASRSASSS
ncbi:hypothetical protein ACWGQL_30500 [Streptomyces lydicus]